MRKSAFAVALLVVISLPVMAGESLRLCPIRSDVNGVVRVPVDLHDGPPAVSVSFGDKGPYRFILDTSVRSALIVDKSLARELELPHRGTEKIVSPATRPLSSCEIVGVDRISLGTARFDDLLATVRDVRGTFHADGIIGFGLFGQVVAALDFANGELRISRGALPRDAANVQALKLFGGVPSLVIAANDRHFFASINTEVPVALTVPQRLDASSSADLRVGNVKLAGARIVSVDTFPLPNVGDEFLANALVTFDAAHGLVAVEPVVRQ